MTTTTQSQNDDYSLPNLDNILQVAQEAVLLAGKEIRKVMLDSDISSTTTIKSDTTDLVTETDQKCEELITNHILSRYPSHKIIGEETSGAECQYTLTDAPTWTIDPIDGTTNFVHKLPLTCVLVAFLWKKQPMVGVTYDPMSGELFYALKGRGAFRRTTDGISKQIHVSTTASLQSAVVAMDAGYGRSVEVVDRFLELQRKLLLQNIRHIRSIGCCGLAMAYVACGRLDAGLEEGSWQNNTGPKIWDFAAGKLLVEEAGGVTRDLTGRKETDAPLNLLRRSVFSASTPELAEELMATIYGSKDR